MVQVWWWCILLFCLTWQIDVNKNVNDTFPMSSWVIFGLLMGPNHWPGSSRILMTAYDRAVIRFLSNQTVGCSRYCMKISGKSTERPDTSPGRHSTTYSPPGPEGCYLPGNAEVQITWDQALRQGRVTDNNDRAFLAPWSTVSHRVMGLTHGGLGTATASRHVQSPWLPGTGLWHLGARRKLDICMCSI